MFVCLIQHQICTFGICLLALFCKKKKRYQEGQVITNYFVQGPFFNLSKSIVYSQTPDTEGTTKCLY